MNIIFIGTSDFATPILKSLTRLNPVNYPNGARKLPQCGAQTIITQPDKLVGRKQKLQASPIKQMALKYNIPIFQPENIKDQKNIEVIKKMRPDLIIVAAYGQILPKEILEIPKFGCLNIHASLLPKYRGASPIQSAILNGDKKTGVTIMLMDKKMDTGKIVVMSNVKCQMSNVTYEELAKELAKEGAELLLKILPKYIQEMKKIMKLWEKEYHKNLTINQIDFIDPLFISRNSSLITQNESKTSYTKILKKEDGKIDWTKSAQEIERQIRAFSPWPGSFTKYKGKNCKIFQTKIIHGFNPCNFKSGEFFLTKNNQLAIKCGKGILIIQELQIEGKKRMSSQEFLKGHSL